MSVSRSGQNPKSLSEVSRRFHGFAHTVTASQSVSFSSICTQQVSVAKKNRITFTLYNDGTVW
jgi:hypothetical protein